MPQLTIKEMRRAKGISLESMAELCNVHVNTYRVWENNPEEIKLGKAMLIAKTFDCELDDVLFMP